MAERDPALQLSHRRKMGSLFAVLLLVFLSALDQTIVGVALKDLPLRHADEVPVEGMDDAVPPPVADA